MDGFINIYIGFIMIIVVAFLFVVLFYFVMGLLLLVPIYLFGLIVSVFYYKMAKIAGCKNGWIAFLPLGKNYLAFALPHREYNIGILKTKHRKRIFWLSSIAELIVNFVMGFGWAIIYAYVKLCSQDTGVMLDTELFDSPFFLVLFIVLLLSGIVAFVLRSIVHGRKNYDLLKTYGYGSFAVWGALLNVICPLVMLIMPVFMAGRVPDYGVGNYYLKRENGIR